MPSASRYVFTINNFLYYPRLHSDYAYLQFQSERGSNGTEHLQGFVCLKKPASYATMRKWFPMAHIERLQGTLQSNVDYCSKEDGRTAGPFCFGKLPVQRGTKRPNLSGLKELLDNGGSLMDVATEDFGAYLRHHKALQAYVNLRLLPRNSKPTVYILFGTTGTGKTSSAIDFAGTKGEKFYIKERSKWWDGYSQEGVCIIDEFYGWIPFGVLLRLIDRYPIQVEYKGGSCHFNSKWIFLTSNKKPEDWYTGEYMDALYRRVDFIYECLDDCFMRLN